MEKIVRDLESMLSRYDQDAEVYNLNQQAAKSAVQISEKLFSYIKQSILYSQKTNGYFNIGYEATGSFGMELSDQLILDNEQKTVQYASEEVLLDFGGIGKGIALSEIALFLEKERIANAFISFGESSILTRGRHPYGDYWPLALEDGATNLKLNNSSISISGFHASEEISHVVNPKIGAFKHRLKQVQVQLDCPIDAEVLSTTLLIAPELEQQQIINRFNPEKCIRIPLQLS
ncbi:hypothetical protein BZG02_05360 [Labilibaculum filiforme]|uniref:FAD:protein FMN transferase n=2 Tax=Labilibaculum filiforme TaxID=1940526 RepID=A0A2N3I1R2_9BACT|nr:hypothetical protein BZG02_05360 [Labilibaculum filiforme]